MKKVGLLDSAWLLLEAPETPMHVGVLLRFSPPPDAPKNYIHSVVAGLRGSTGAVSPWDLILPMQKFRGLIPVWLHESYLNMEHHVRLYALANPGDEQELAYSIAELHSRPLDRTRPLWECHVFTGLADGQFALYMKVHHALLDGVGGIRMMQSMLSHSPDERGNPPPWVAKGGDFGRLRKATRPDAKSASRTPRAAPPEKPHVMSHLTRAAREMARAARSKEDQLATPYRAPSSTFNRRITRSREYATEVVEMARIKRIAHLSGATCNDVVLAVCSGALRRFLVCQDISPTNKLTAAVPVSNRGRHGANTGTSLTFCLANLATEIADPRERLTAIHASTLRGKEYLGRMPLAAQIPFTSMLMLPFIAGHFSKTMSRLRPMFNIVISNVPGPKTPLYLDGARLEAISPLSILFHGQALNITCMRYLDKFSFGFTGCPDVFPDMGRLPALTREALTELENVYSFPHTQASSAKTKAKTKLKPEPNAEQARSAPEKSVSVNLDTGNPDSKAAQT